MSNLFGTWLADTRELQRSSYGADPVSFPTELRLNYIREQTLAAFVELGEFIQNLTWKPWAKEKRVPSGDARTLAVRELVDVLHFVANDLIALGVTDTELNEEYARKMQINRERMKDGGH